MSHTYFDLTPRYEVPGAMLNAQNINISQTVPGFPQLPGGVPGLNIYFVVRYVGCHVVCSDMVGCSLVCYGMACLGTVTSESAI